jgi:hypothetical protein
MRQVTSFWKFKNNCASKPSRVRIAFLWRELQRLALAFHAHRTAMREHADRREILASLK